MIYWLWTLHNFVSLYIQWGIVQSHYIGCKKTKIHMRLLTYRFNIWYTGTVYWTWNLIEQRPGIVSYSYRKSIVKITESLTRMRTLALVVRFEVLTSSPNLSCLSSANFSICSDGKAQKYKPISHFKPSVFVNAGLNSKLDLDFCRQVRKGYAKGIILQPNPASQIISCSPACKVNATYCTIRTWLLTGKSISSDYVTVWNQNCFLSNFQQRVNVAHLVWQASSQPSEHNNADMFVVLAVSWC